MFRTAVHRIIAHWPEFTGEDARGLYLRRVGVVSNTAPLGLNEWFLSSFGVWREERWRLCSGGGIAGHSGEWWIVCLPDGKKKYGPFRTVKTLRAALRCWRKWEVPREGGR